jgi:hexokinase
MFARAASRLASLKAGIAVPIMVSAAVAARKMDQQKSGLLCTCETAERALPERSKNSLPEGTYSVEGQYLWDSWIVGAPVEALLEHEKTEDARKAPKLKLFRYGLTAAKEECENKSNNRHGLAKVRCATSIDDGKTWVDQGVILRPREDEEWPNLVIWTSQTMILNGKWVMWVTGRNQGDQKDPTGKDLMDSQKIGRVTSKDGIKWLPSEIEVVLRGKDDKEAKKMGYDMTNDDNVVAAFRDPMVFHSDGKLHMVFAAKHRKVEDGKEYLLPTVGYATSTDNEGKPGSWKIQSPIVLPHYKELEKYNIDTFKKNKPQTPLDDTVRQIEVPYVVQRKDAKGKEYTYLFVSTQSNPNGETNSEKRAAFRGYVSKNGMNGPFKALYGHVEPEFNGEPDKIYEHALYGPTVSELPGDDGKKKYVASTFYSEDTFWPLTGTPLFPVTWDDRPTPPVPRFHFPDPKDILNKGTKYLYDKALELGKEKLAQGGDSGLVHGPRIGTGGNVFPGIFLWDTAFSIFWMRYHQDIFPCARSLDNFYRLQEYDGCIRREYDAKGKPVWPKEHPINFAPPILAWAELALYEENKDINRLKIVYPHLKRHFEWCKANWQKENGLYFGDCLGTGMDNLPRYPDQFGGSSDDHIPLDYGRIASPKIRENTKKDYGSKIDSQWNRQGSFIDMSSQVVFNAKNLGKIASLIGEHMIPCLIGQHEEKEYWDKEEDYWNTEYDRLKRLVHKKCWSDKHKFYFDLDDHDEPIIRYHIGGFWPLLAEIVPEECLKDYLGHLKDKEKFDRCFPVPSLAADERDYDKSGGYWLGSSWPCTTYMILTGLKAYGKDELAKEIAEKYVSALNKVYHDTGTIWENNCPEDIKPGSQSDGSRCNPDFCGWGGLGPVAITREFLAKDFNLKQWLRDQKVSLDIDDAKALVDTIVEEMERGLNEEKSSLGMFPAYISANGMEAVPKNKTVAVIDAGGTNLRIGLAKSDNEGKITLDMGEPQPMPGQNKEEKLTAKDFYDVLGNKLELEPIEGEVEAIGFCFSFPTITTDDHDGILERWTKEVSISEMVGIKLGVGLKETLKRPNMKVVVLNDTVATLLAGVMWAKEEGLKASSYVGFILGTGTNTAYVEKNHNICKVEGDQGSQIINVESGGFAHFKRGPSDKQLDEDSENQGKNFLEKATSGEYLGLLTLHLLKEPIFGAVLSEEAKKNLSSLQKLKTEDVSNLCRDNEDDTGELERTSFTNDDVAIMKTVFGAVVERAALLSAVSITAAILKSGAGKDEDQPVIICIDGSTYYKTFQMQEKVEKYLKKLLLQDRQLHYRCVSVENAPAIGAAIAGLTTFQKMKD